MLIRKAPDLRYRDATPKHLYLHRREFIRAAGVAMGAAAVGMSGSLSSVLHAQSDGTGHNAKIPNLKKGGTYSSVPGEKTTTFEDVTSYNNFYEYGYDKSDPKAGAGRLKPRPWSITVEGFVAKKGTFGFDEFIKPHTIEERVYRMRCVEAWSRTSSRICSRHRRPSTSSSSPRSTRRRCRRRTPGFCRGPMWKGCVWTRR
jgi:sulfoxide reductase catalytic subunit YedY